MAKAKGKKAKAPATEQAAASDEQPHASAAAPAKKAAKERLDQLLVDRGLAESRTRAQAIIMAGLVIVGDHKVDKPGTKVNAESPITLKGQDHPWVSRGGLKLVKGLDHFDVSPQGWTCLDVGASTGGFTDVLLTNGAEKVYAVDVGYGQLAHKLRVDERVVVMERTNARSLDPSVIPDPIDLLVCDASFIGLRTVLDMPLNLIRAGGKAIALIKPQFEVGKDRVGKGGVVRDPALHQEVCDTISDWFSHRPGWVVHGLTESPIKGPEGNVEFLICAERQEVLAAVPAEERGDTTEG